jgi:thiamine-monophosphate kinase
MPEKSWIAKYFAPLVLAEGAVGLRDDVAALDTRGAMIITTDALVEGVHFLSTDPLETIARKLVRVNVSDIIAKGAVPVEVLLMVGWPQGRSETDLGRFAGALGVDLKLWGARLIGGDTTSVPGGLVLSITMTGRCHGPGPIRRFGALDGDDIWLTGEIGAAKLGFDALRRRETASPFIGRYHVPEPPMLAAAALIARYARASLDVSDGLLADVKALAGASGLAARLDLGVIPFAGAPTTRPEQMALATWGDDYQTVFTAPPEAANAIAVAAAEIGLKLTRVGTCEPGKGLSLYENNKPVNLPETLGFEHG